MSRANLPRDRAAAGEYVKYLGFTHVELLPIMEHPFFGSWGYQTTGYFAPTSRYGTPQTSCTWWIFCTSRVSESFSTGYLRISHLMRTDSPISTALICSNMEIRGKASIPDWKTHIFNYGRNEVRSFLMSSGALFWLDKYHIDGLRVDAVASMLYLDYSRKEGEWIPNSYGGRENLEAIDFLRQFNSEAIYKEYPDIQTIAEESTAWPAVSKPTYVGGLGFGLKWDMGWMHDTLKYFRERPSSPQISP